MSHRHLRILAVLTIMLAGSLGALQSISAPPPASADVHEGDSTIQLPLRWCAVKGSPAASDLSTIDAELAARADRANAAILQPGAQIELLSVIPAPHIPDIDDPLSDYGAPGDILDPRVDPGELNLAIASCRMEWDGIASAIRRPIPGPIALNIGQFVDKSDQPIGLGGWGGYTVWSPAEEHPCDGDSEPITASGGYFAVEDFSVKADPDEDGQLIAHELGHVLLLSHGDGQDNDSDGFYDQRCDPWELPPATAETVMHPSIPATGDMSELQRATSRHISYIYAGSQFGGSGDPEVGRTVSDQRADQAGDVDTPSIDQTYVELVLNEKVGEEFVSLTVTQGLLGLVYPDATSEYYVFIDLDGSPEEGGFPEELGLPTQMGGVELVIQVLVDVDRHASATVWRYDGNEFVDETDSAVLEVQLTSPDGGEEPTPMFDVVTTTLGFSLGTLEIGEELVNIQTVATDGAAFDVLPGEAGAGSSDQVVPLYIVEPELPEG